MSLDIFPCIVRRTYHMPPSVCVCFQVDYSGGYSTFSLARFGQKFLAKAANPKNLLLWHQRREKQGDLTIN